MVFFSFICFFQNSSGGRKVNGKATAAATATVAVF